MMGQASQALGVPPHLLCGEKRCMASVAPMIMPVTACSGVMLTDTHQAGRRAGSSQCRWTMTMLMMNAVPRESAVGA